MEAVTDGTPPDHRQLRVDVDGPLAWTRKKRVSKYWRSPTERVFNRWPSTVSTHLDRKRVSNENRPVGSVGDASMSPRPSLTTNVLPSRILIRSSLTPDPLLGGRRVAARARGSREDPLDQDHELRIALERQVAAQIGGHRVHVASRDRVEQASIRSHNAVRRGVLARSGDFAPVERDEPAIDPLAVGEVEADAPGRLLQQRLVAATVQFVEELRGRIGHLGRTPRVFCWHLIRPGRAGSISFPPESKRSWFHGHQDEGLPNGDRSPRPASERTSRITTLRAAVTGNSASAPASPAGLGPITNTMMTSSGKVDPLVTAPRPRLRCRGRLVVHRVGGRYTTRGRGGSS